MTLLIALFITPLMTLLIALLITLLTTLLLTLLITMLSPDNYRYIRGCITAQHDYVLCS